MRIWPILKRVLEIAVGLVALIALWQWLAPSPVRLSVLVKQDEVQIPSAYREYLQSIDGDRDGLGKVHDAATAASKPNDSPFRSYPLDRLLTAIRGFNSSVPIFRYPDPRVIVVKIVNDGRKTADYVKVFFRDSGFVEITKDATPVTPPQNGGWINLGPLEPHSQFLVTMWSKGNWSSDDVRVISNEGETDVRQWYVSRDKSRWVIGFNLTDVVFWSFIAICLLGLVISIVMTNVEAKQMNRRNIERFATEELDVDRKEDSDK